jgi:beta-lactamase regulating signal transducer with metallopeptidase domain
MNPMLFASTFFGAGPLALIAKATAVLLLAALVAAVVLPRASAAVRHLVWLIALAGCAALAIFSPVAPPLVVKLPVDDSQTVFVNHIRPQTIAAPVIYSVGTGLFSTTRPIAARAFPRPARSQRSSSNVTWPQAFGGALLAAVWIIGCLVVLGRCVLGHVAIARLVKRARRVTSAEWEASLVAAMVDAGARRTVDLLISDELSAPVTTGFIHPIILLPDGADDWSDERRRVVLVHEVAHIVRFDYAAQLVATLAGALFWFHPLAWLASARLRAEAENAADDRVLATGTAGVAYAGHLLDLARMESGMPLTAAVAVGMVRASRLERRFRAMLDTTRSRSSLPGRLPAVATSLTLAAMVPLAGARMTIVSTPHDSRVTIDRAQNTTIAVASATTRSLTTITIGKQTVAAMATVATGDSIIEKTIDASAGERLTLDLAAGGSIVVHGWDEPRIRMRATLAGRDWRDVRVTLERTRNGAQLQSGFSEPPRSWSTDNTFELWVPRHMDINLSSAGGSVAISDLTGEFRGHTGGGAITIEGANGSATLTTGGGDVSVMNSTLGGTVSTGGGGVYISNVSGGLTGSSGSGPVVRDGIGGTPGWRSSVGYSRASTVTGGVDGGMTVSNGSTYTIGDGGSRTVTTTRTSTGIGNSIGSGIGTGVGTGIGAFTYSKAGGDIMLDEIPRGGRISTGGGRVYVGSSGGFLSVSTGGGDVELPQMGGDANVWTGSGTVTITVVNTDGTEHSVDVTSGSGRVVLELPADLDATIELESAYTENFARKTSISSELSLTQSETQTWDDGEGTPRKFVRARGIAGNGRGLIRVRTVNGDIVVRRR